jgi:hypothetical protein
VYFRITEGRRDRWTVKVPAKRLAKCCDERMEYHAGRLKFWDAERRDAEEKLRAVGIQLRHFAVTGGQRMEAQLDAGLAKRVSECEQRLKTNQDALAKFRAFKALLTLAGDEPGVELTADDVLYFNLEGADAGNESGGDEDF